jgi:hypothetical protein
LNNRREIIYGPESLDKTPEFIVDLGLVKHSGEFEDKEDKIERKGSMAKIHKPERPQNKWCIHVIVRN